MNSIVIYRIFRNGFLNFWRNIWLSAAATLVMTITLVILSILSLLFIITNYSVSTIKERVDMSAYFKVGLAETQILKIKGEVERNEHVKEVVYISADEALADFKAKHLNDDLINKSIEELNENPLPATLRIKANNLEDYPALAELLQSDKYQSAVDKVNFEDNRLIIERLNRLLKFIITVGLGLMVVFAIIAILVIFNTITLTIYNRREEIEIMRLVGATNWYIRAPFLIEAGLYSIAATLVTSLLFIPVYHNLLPTLNNYLNPEGSIFQQNYLNIWYIIGIMLLVSLTLSMFSTLLSMRKYLRI